jgi:hypothetical protein
MRCREAVLNKSGKKRKVFGCVCRPKRENEYKQGHIRYTLPHMDGPSRDLQLGLIPQNRPPTQARTHEHDERGSIRHPTPPPPSPSAAARRAVLQGALLRSLAGSPNRHSSARFLRRRSSLVLAESGAEIRPDADCSCLCW